MEDIIMFFKKEYSPSEIMGYEISDDELQQFIEENNILCEIVDNSTRWCAFAHYYGRTHGLNDVSATSFAYMVSIFMTGMGISASTEMYIKEETIEGYLLDYLNELRTAFPDDEEEQAKCLFLKTFKIYSEVIDKYEYKTEKLDMRLGFSIYDKFMKVEGKTKADKLRNLLDSYYK